MVSEWQIITCMYELFKFDCVCFIGISQTPYGTRLWLTVEVAVTSSNFPCQPHYLGWVMLKYNGPTQVTFVPVPAFVQM